MTSIRASEISWSYPSAPALDLNGPTVPFRPFREDWIDRPAVELFRSAAEEFGDHVACEDLTGQLTYGQVWAASRRLAHMIDAAVPAGQPVGVLLPNEAAYPVAVLACLAANRPCVMIDRHHPQDRVAGIVRDAGLGAIVLRQSDGVAAASLPVGVRTIVIDEALQDGPAPDGLPAAPVPPHEASFIVYTSGSTGHPKGIVLSQRAVLHRARQLVDAVHLRPDDKVLSLASPSTIGGLQQIFEVMLSGATLVKLDLLRTGLGTVLQAIAQRRLTMMFSTPAVWRSVAGIPDAAVALASLRCIQTSGDALLAIDFERLRRVLPADCHVLSVYGATEAPALLQWFVTSKLPDDGPRVPAGYPLPGFAFALLDDAGNAVNDGEPGELVVKSSWMSLGIWGNGAVQPGPFEQDRRDLAAPVYRTGDIVLKRSDGLFVTLGRKDRQIKILGNRVEPAEVETVLRQAPEVADAAVVARRVEGDARLLAFFVPRAGGSSDTAAALRRYLKEKLPAHMQPSQLFRLEELPLLPGRKVDEEALLAHAAGHSLVPSAASSQFETSYPTAPVLDLNGPTVPFRRFREEWVDRPVLDLFRLVVDEFGDQVACEDFATRLTYVHLWAACRHLSRTIDACVAAGQAVGILLPNEAAYPAAILACLAANRPCVMIDRHQPQERIAAIVRDAGLAAVILRRSEITDGLLLPAGIRTIVIDEALEDRRPPDELSGASMSPGAAAFIVYTSGSTGQPKGIAISQRAILHRVGQLINAVHFRPDDRLLSLASPSTIAGLQHIFETILTGAALVKLDLQRTGLAKVVQAIGDMDVTMMFTTPAVWRSVAQIDNVAPALASLRCVHSSGDALLAIDLEQLRGVLSKKCHVLSSYGATEAPAILQWFVPPGFAADGPRVPAGYPLPGYTVALLDENGKAVPQGRSGELVVRSPWMSLGLWRGGAIHSGLFQQDIDSREAVYRTGDVASRNADGLVVMLGRKDRQIKVLGNRVELGEIETALRQLPEVRDAAVVARTILGEPTVLAFVVLREAGPSSIAGTLRKHLKERLPAYMEPSELFVLDELPLLPGRKVDEEALLAHAAQRSTVKPVAKPFEDSARPAQHSIDIVREAWRLALGRPALGDERSFDEAGGDSLRLLLLVLHLERLCGRALPLDQFHGGLGPAGFARVLDRLKDGPPPVSPDAQPMVFLVPGKWGDTPLLARFRMACAKSIRIVPTSYPDLGGLARGGYEDIVAHLLAQIERFAPDGPILLAGYSLGGDFAYAIAERLSKRGRRISALLVLDTDAEPYDSGPPAERRGLAQRVSTLGRLAWKRDWATIAEAVLTPSVVTSPAGIRALRFAVSFRLSTDNLFMFRLSWHLRSMLVQFHRGAWIRQAPNARLSVPVVLFRSEEGGVDLGWEARTEKLTIVPVPGNHVSMLDPENSEDLVAEFNRAVHTAWGHDAALSEG
ncbi:AMP-binding protein [Reyranella aquatilis]|uniref:AMP-binding protein n=1 Tax=Reyranella aquatilis TaxID=2035356 RepID=A0ABS8KNU5_9HYPH|nr:AMP-binding protein [Reyranella aquatilis]MCC8427336.1 AMP-binding protein [Reyranella aquatilis]